jgi:CheY-like chemotaxis protein
MAKVLVVDDEALLRAILQDGLEAAGHQAIVADSGRIALEIAKIDRPDCVLLDVMMPGMDGYETCAAFKADPDLAPIPIILVSATTDLRVVDRAEEVGAAGVLPKPIPFEQLQHAVSLALDGGSI